MSNSQRTIDHEEIKSWAVSHNAIPAVVEDEDASTSILRFKVTDTSDQLKEINWEHFFELFESNSLAFLHDGEASNFNKFVSREDKS